MRKMISMMFCVAVIGLVGCASSAGSSAGKLSTGVNTSAHEWEMPNFTYTEGNPASSELGLGLVTVGSNIGWGDHATGKWISLSADVGPSDE